jgi:signal peptidase I
VKFFYSVFITVLVVAVFISGCSKPRRQQACRMTNEYVVAKTASAPQALKIRRISRDRLIVLWSADKETWYLFINNDGIKRSEPVALLPEKKIMPGNIKTFWHANRHNRMAAREISISEVKGDIVAIAVLTESDENSSNQVYVFLVDIKKEKVIIKRKIAVAGDFSRYVAVDYLGDDIVVAWHNTQKDKTTVSFALLKGKSLNILQTGSLKSSLPLAGPSLKGGKDNILMAWSVQTALGSTVMLANLNSKLTVLNKTVLGKSKLTDGSVVLSSVGKNVGFAFRSDEDEDGRWEFYFGMFKNGRIIHPAARISRADGPKGPHIAFKNNLVFSAQIRSYQNNLLVGFNRFNYQGVKKGGEFQVYADKSDFTLTDLDASGDKVLLLYAEVSDRFGRILSSTLSCH